MIKVQRCPFCGHDKMEVIKDDYGNGKYVLCPISEDGCGAQGPIGGSDVAAVILWNSFRTLNSFSGKDINILDLSARAENCLRLHGIRTIHQLTLMSSTELLELKNLGKESLREIKEKLIILGLSLRTPTASPTAATPPPADSVSPPP
jgi:hypothetical protein